MKIASLITRRQLSVLIRSLILTCIHLSLGRQVPHSTRVQNNLEQVSNLSLSLKRLIFMQAVLFYLNCAQDSPLSMKEQRPYENWDKSTAYHKASQIILVQRAHWYCRWRNMTLNIGQLHLKSFPPHSFRASEMLKSYLQLNKLQSVIDRRHIQLSCNTIYQKLSHNLRAILF